MSDVFRWFTSEIGHATFDYVGGLLLGYEVFATVLGENRVKKVKDFFDRLRDKLNPNNSKRLALKITVGPVAIITLLLTFAAFGWVVVQEVDDPETWRLLSSGDLNYFRSMVRIFWVILFKPLLCLGLAAGVYVSRSVESDEQFVRWLEHLKQSIYESQLKRDLVSKFLFAFTVSLVIIAFAAGVWIGSILMKIVFRSLETPLRIAGYLLERRRLRRILASAGLVMITVSFLLRMVSPN